MISIARSEAPDEALAPDDRAARPLPAVVLAGLGKAFGARRVLHGVDLAIRDGEFVSILGASGCGKTTLLRILAGLEAPTAGELRFPASGGRPSTRMMFQEDRLLPWRRVLENVTLGLPRAERPRGLEILGRVGLADRAFDWPHTLSGGQRQRVALARALAHHPSLLLLDEPFGSLDALTRAEMQQLLESLWLEHRVTVLLVTHDIEEALRLSDRVCVLSDERVAHETAVRLPRPRRRTSASLVRERDQLEDLLHELGASGRPAAPALVPAPL